MSTLRTTNVIHGSSAVSNLVLDNQGRAIFGPDGPQGRASLYVNAQTNRVGVNTESPSVALDVDGGINATGNVAIGGTLSVTGNVDFSGTIDADNEFLTVGGMQIRRNLTPTSGAGIEIFRSSGGYGQIQSYDRDGSSLLGLYINSSTWNITQTGHADFSGDVEVGSQFRVVGSANTAANVRIQYNGGTTEVSVHKGDGTLYIGGSNLSSGSPSPNLALYADGRIKAAQASIGSSAFRTNVDIQDGTDTTQCSIGTSPQFGSSQTDATLQLTGNQGDNSGPSIVFSEQNVASLSTTGRGARIQSIRVNRSSNRQMKLAINAANNDGTTVPGLEVGPYRIDAFVNSQESLRIYENKVVIGSTRNSGSSSSTGSAPEGGTTKIGYGGYVISHFDKLSQNGTLVLTVDTLGSAIYSGMLSITAANLTAGADRVSQLYFIAYSNQYQVQTKNLIDGVSAGSSPPTFTLTLATSGRIIITSTDSRDTEYCVTFMGSCV